MAQQRGVGSSGSRDISHRMPDQHPPGSSQWSKVGRNSRCLHSGTSLDRGVVLAQGGRARGWHPHTLVNVVPTGVKILDRPNWSLDRLTVS